MAVYKFYDGTNWVELAKKSDIPSLTGYATETWVGNNYLPLSGGTLTGSIAFNVGLHIRLNTTSNNNLGNYISAGGGYSSSSGLNGVKVVSCDQSDCQSGLGQDLNPNNYPYDMCVVACNDSTDKGHLSFVSHSITNSSRGPTTYRELADFYDNAGTVTFDVKGSILENGTALSSKYVSSSSSGMQLITSTGTDTPLRLKGSTGDTYLEFLNSSGTSLGFFAVLSTHKPSFFYGGNHEIALVENVVNLSSSGSQFVNATSTNTPMCFQGSDTGSCVIGFYNSNQTGLGFIGVKSGNVPYFYNPVSQQDHNIIIDSDLGDQVTFSLSGTKLTITRK